MLSLLKKKKEVLMETLDEAPVLSPDDTLLIRARGIKLVRFSRTLTDKENVILAQSRNIRQLRNTNDPIYKDKLLIQYGILNNKLNPFVPIPNKSLVTTLVGGKEAYTVIGWTGTFYTLMDMVGKEFESLPEYVELITN